MSNVIFCDGFDHYTTVLDKWDQVQASHGSSGSQTVAIMPGSGRGGAGAVYCTVSAFNAAGAAQVIKLIGAHTTLYVGMAVNVNATSQNVDSPLVSFLDQSSGVQLALLLTSTGVLYVARGGYGGTTLGTASVAYPQNSYHYIEVELVLGSGTSGSVIVKVDQSAVITATGVNTQGTGFTNFAAVGFGPTTPFVGANNATSYSAYFDDIYLDTAGFNGDVRVNGLLPAGNGSTQNFTGVEASWVASTVTNLQTTIVDSNSNLQRATAITGDFKTGTTAPTWATGLGASTTDNHVTWTNLGAVSQYKLVNEGDPDGDSSYIKDNVVGDISRFTYPTINGNSVVAAVVWANARKDDGGFRTIQASIKSGATVGTSGTDVPLGTNYQYLMLQSSTDPNTGAAWTLAGVNAAEFGIKITN